MPRKLAIPALAAALLLGGCARFGATTVEDTVPSPPPPEHRSTVLYESSGGQPAGPAKTKATDLVGRWGFASYHRPEDRDRTLAAAEKTCDHPYLIGEGRSGGVVMHLADQSEPVELTLKGSTEGHDFLGPEGPAGGEKDRRILSFDGRTLTMDFVNDEIGGRYGTQIYVRCSAVEEEAKTNIRKPAAGPATAKPKAAPNPKKTAAKSPDKPKGKAVGQKTDVTGGVRTAPPPDRLIHAHHAARSAPTTATRIINRNPAPSFAPIDARNPAIATSIRTPAHRAISALVPAAQPRLPNIVNDGPFRPPAASTRARRRRRPRRRRPAAAVPRCRPGENDCSAAL